MVFISVVAFLGGIPGTGGVLKLIDTDRLKKPDILILDKLLYHGIDNVVGGEGIHSDIMDGRDGTAEPGTDGEKEMRGDTEAGMDKIRADSKRPAAVFTNKAVGREGCRCRSRLQSGGRERACPCPWRYWLVLLVAIIVYFFMLFLWQKKNHRSGKLWRLRSSM